MTRLCELLGEQCHVGLVGRHSGRQLRDGGVEGASAGCQRCLGRRQVGIQRGVQRQLTPAYTLGISVSETTEGFPVSVQTSLPLSHTLKAACIELCAEAAMSIGGSSHKDSGASSFCLAP